MVEKGGISDSHMVLFTHDVVLLTHRRVTTSTPYALYSNGVWSSRYANQHLQVEAIFLSQKNDGLPCSGEGGGGFYQVEDWRSILRSCPHKWRWTGTWDWQTSWGSVCSDAGSVANASDEEVCLCSLPHLWSTSCGFWLKESRAAAAPWRGLDVCLSRSTQCKNEYIQTVAFESRSCCVYDYCVLKFLFISIFVQHPQC